jgi:D-sedoheptulose 7-phosphate isomerase
MTNNGVEKTIGRVNAELEASCKVKQRFSDELKAQIAELAQHMAESVLHGGTIYWMGNGGSAADAQHLAAELVVKLHRQRAALPSVAFTVNTSVLTAAGNDMGFEEIYARQVEAFVKKGDVLIGISTSGNSENIVRGVRAGNKKQALTVGWTGESGGRLADLVHMCLRIPSDDTQRIQECHITIGHIICGIVEDVLEQRQK